jgi:hypothetical protein
LAVGKRNSGAKGGTKVTGAQAGPKRPAGSNDSGPAPDVELPPQPSTEDPHAQAEWFVSLLDAFAQHGSPEAAKLRRGLLDVVNEYDAADDKVAARAVAAGRIAGMQAGIAELVLRSARKMRDRFVKESRKRGTASRDGKSLRVAADGFTKMVEGLEMMAQAARAGDEALSARGEALMDEARAAMEPHLAG